MIPEILLIDAPSPIWSSYLAACEKGLGFSPADIVDKSGRKWGDYAKYLISISVLGGDAGDAVSLIQSACSYGSHLHFSFLVRADYPTLFSVMSKTKLKVTCNMAVDGTVLAVISGTLLDWKTATLDCCQEKQPFTLRLLFDKVYLLFEKLGLVEYWSDCKTKAHTDKTFLLEYNP